MSISPDTAREVTEYKLAQQMLYEGLKEKGALMLIPSSAVESMGMGGMLGAAALRQQKLTGGDRVD